MSQSLLRQTVVLFVCVIGRSLLNISGKRTNSGRLIAVHATSVHSPLTQRFDQSAWESLYSTCKQEVCTVIGRNLPHDLYGNYFRNGGGKFEAGESLITHPFDADGMMVAIDIQNGTATFRNRMIRTEVFNKERKARRIVMRGSFGTPKSGGFLANLLDPRLRDVANTNVIYWNKQLLALFESTTPHRLEPDSLRTIGKTRLNGLLKPNQPFSAHPKFDAATGRLVSFSSQPRGTSTTDMTVYEFDQQFDVVKQRTIKIPGFVFFHDFLVTENHYIFTLSPLKFNPWPFLLGRKGPAECIQFDASGQSQFILIPRDAALPPQYVPVDPHFNFHYANGYEIPSTGTSDNHSRAPAQAQAPLPQIVIDTIRADRMELGSPRKPGEPVWKGLDYAATVPPYRLIRYTLSPTNTGTYSYEKRELTPTQLDFPSVHPRVVGKKHRYVFATASCDDRQSAPIQGVVKLDLGVDGSGTSSQQGVVEDRWCPAPHEFVGEVVFAPKRGADANAAEDDGYLLSYLWDGRAKQSYFVIFDAHNVSQGPLHRCQVPTNVAFGLHGCFVPDLVFDTQVMQKKFEAFSALDKKDWNVMNSGFSGLGW